MLICCKYERREYIRRRKLCCGVHCQPKKLVCWLSKKQRKKKKKEEKRVIAMFKCSVIHNGFLCNGPNRLDGIPMLVIHP